MRAVLFICVLAGMLGYSAYTYNSARTQAHSTSYSIATAGSSAETSPANAVNKPTTSERVDFQSQIKPILENRCQPCHFNGGKVYSEMPFDRPHTITTLGTRLFTRIKDEKERQLIRDFLTQK